MVGHDLREPMRSVSNYAQLLLKSEGHLLTDKGRRWLESFILVPANRLSILATELQNYVENTINADPDTARQIDVNRLAGEALEMLNGQVAEAGATITFNQLPSTATGTVAIRSVFTNLISNALKYRHPDRHPQIQVWAYRHDERPLWVIGVTDNGLGFDPKFARAIFALGKRLYGANSEYWGSGIGLAVVKHHVENWGGTISATSKPGIGSTFTFTVPV